MAGMDAMMPTGGAGGMTAVDPGGPIMDACHMDPPPGAAMPPAPPAYTGGTCPMLMPGRNKIMTAGGAREFLLLTPADMKPDEKLPLIFFWVWLGGNAMDFVKIIDMQKLVDARRFIAAVPEKKGDLLFSWPVEITVADTRRSEDYTFFDDILSCVSEQYTVNTGCVSSIGVSAGALFTGQLIGGRGDYLASAVVLSGGTGGVIKPYAPPKHKLPVMTLWGGPNDFLILFFEPLSKDLETGAVANGQFLIECVHNCGHAVPPFDGGSAVDPPLDFIMEHPYWLKPGESPFTSAGLPPSFPSWCAIGQGKATIRTGMCMAPKF